MSNYSLGDVRSIFGEQASSAKPTKPAALFSSAKDAALVIPERPQARASTDSSTDAAKAAQDSQPQRHIETPAERAAKNLCTLFVGNVPASVAKRQFESPFKKFGKITSSRFRSVPVKEKYQKSNKRYGVMKKDFVEDVATEKLSQNGYIVFADAASVKAAVESGLSGTAIFGNGHFVRLDYAARPVDGEQPSSAPSASAPAAGAVKKFDRKKSLYIPHLPAGVTDVDVITAIEAQDDSLKSTVKGVRIVKSAKDGVFAYVLLADRASATKAIKLSPPEGIDYKFPNQKNGMKLKLTRILKDEELAQEKQKKQQEFRDSAKIAAKKSLSRVKWQTRLSKQGSDKIVSHFAMSRQERQETLSKRNGARRRIDSKGQTKYAAAKPGVKKFIKKDGANKNSRK